MTLMHGVFLVGFTLSMNPKGHMDTRSRKDLFYDPNCNGHLRSRRKLIYNLRCHGDLFVRFNLVYDP